MKIFIGVIMCLLIALSPASARDYSESTPDSSKSCMTKIGSLGHLIRRHNPKEDHMRQLRRQARKASALCRDERFTQADKLLEKMKRSVMAVNNEDDFNRSNKDKRTAIRECLDQADAIQSKVKKINPIGRDKDRLASLEKRMRRNCRFERFSRAESDYKYISIQLDRLEKKHSFQTADFKSPRGCANTIRAFNRRIDQDKITSRIRVWIRKNTKEIYNLCRKKKFSQAERRYNSILQDYDGYLKEEKDPQVAQRMEKEDKQEARGCRRAYTYLFSMINKKSLSRSQRRDLLAKRKTVGDYCFEKDYGAAKALFKEVRQDLDKIENKGWKPVSTRRDSARRDSASSNNDNNDTIRSNAAISPLSSYNCSEKLRQTNKELANNNLPQRDYRRIKVLGQRIAYYCEQEQYKRANKVYMIQQKRLAYFRSKGTNHANVNQGRVTRRADKQDQGNNQEVSFDSSESCMQGFRSLIRKISDETDSFRTQVRLRRISSPMIRHCRMSRFKQAENVYHKTLRAINRH